MQSSWYVLHVETGSEENVKYSLNKIAGVKALVPRHEKIERRQGKSKKVIRTIFPSYVFCNIYLTPKVYYRIKNTPRVYKFLGTEKPEPIKNSEIMHILNMCDKEDSIGISDAIIAGKSIKVLSGPLIGLEGQIIKVNRRKGRVKVRFDILGSQRIVELSVNFVQVSS